MQQTQLVSFESWPIFCRARSRQARSRQSRLWRRLCVSCFDTSVSSTQLTSCFSHQWSPTPSITVSPVSAGGGPGDLDPLKMCRYLVQRWKVALMSLNALFLPTSLGRCVESYRFDFWEIGLEKHAKSLKINGHEDLKCYMTASEVRKLHKWLVKISQNHPNWISTRISLPVQPVVVGSKAARQAWEQPLALLSRCNTDVQTCKNTRWKNHSAYSAAFHCTRRSLVVEMSLLNYIQHMSNYFSLCWSMSKLPTSDCILCCPSAVLNCLMQLTQLMLFESWPIFCRARSRQARSRQSRLWRRLCVSCFDTSVWGTQLTMVFPISEAQPQVSLSVLSVLVAARVI